MKKLPFKRFEFFFFVLCGSTLVALSLLFLVFPSGLTAPDYNYNSLIEPFHKGKERILRFHAWIGIVLVVFMLFQLKSFSFARNVFHKFIGYVTFILLTIQIVTSLFIIKGMPGGALAQATILVTITLVLFFGLKSVSALVKKNYIKHRFCMVMIFGLVVQPVIIRILVAWQRPQNLNSFFSIALPLGLILTLTIFYKLAEEKIKT